jgi:DGQHR domain-containing protein
VFKFSQPAGDFYLASLPAQEVIRIARADPRRYDPDTHRTVGGIQREPTARRIREIAEYSRTVDASFPTAIILSVPEDHYKLSSDEKQIELVGDGPFADIVDGQHRLLGLAESDVARKFSLPVVLLLEATEEQEALLFATINGKQTKVSASLIYELFDVTEGRSPQKTAHEIARVLNSKTDSPWFERLKMLGRRTRPGSNETITQGTFVRELLQHISSNPAADFDAARRGKPVPVDPGKPVFRRYYEAGEDEAIVRILVNVFGAQRDVWPTEWDDPNRSILTKTTGFMATMWAMADMVRWGQERKKLTREAFSHVFRGVRARLRKDDLSLSVQHFSSSAEGIRRLRTLFVDAVHAT